MKNFGTLEYVLDKFSRNWSWKVTGHRAVIMVSKVIPQSWYGDGPNEAIIPDTVQNVQKIKWINERYPLEILSKSIWKKKIANFLEKKKKPKKQRAPLSGIQKEKKTPGGFFVHNLSFRVYNSFLKFGFWEKLCKIFFLVNLPFPAPIFFLMGGGLALPTLGVASVASDVLSRQVQVSL